MKCEWVQQQIHTRKHASKQASNQQTLTNQCTSIININNNRGPASRIHRERERSKQRALRYAHKVNVRTVYGRVLYDDGDSGGDGRGGMQTHTHTCERATHV